jgi:hypothetical protein
MRTLALLAAAALLPGCAALDGPFDGTWLFQIDPNASYQGDCEPDPEDYVTEYTGNSAGFVDIYSTATNQVVVMLTESLVGTTAGTEIEASWEYGYQTDTFTELESYDFSATLTANVLEGSVQHVLQQDDDGTTYECAAESDFTAERIIDHPDRYAGN